MSSIASYTEISRPALSQVPATRPEAPAAKPASASGETGFTFSDFLSAINPLQHIPIVGTIYRAITGDQISPAVKVLGSALLGGPLGLVAAVGNAILEQATGKDLGDQALALFMPSKAPPVEPPAQYAAAPTLAIEPQAGAQAVQNQTAQTEDHSETGVEPVVAAAVTPAAANPPLPELRQEAQRVSPRSFVTPAAGGGRPLAEYQAYAGHRMPVIDAGKGGGSSVRGTPIPLQTTLPLSADQVRTAVLPAARLSAPTAAVKSETETSAATPAAATAPAEGKDWVTAVMMRGLDRYKEMKQRQTNDLSPPAQRIDTVL